MPFPIRYSIRASSEYDEIIDYVASNFGIETALKVDSHFEEIITQISINPRLFPYSEKKKDLHRCIISPQTTLYYRFSGRYVELVSFRGNRMNPATLNI